MTAGGWIIMILSVGFVTGLFAWCIWRVLRTPEATRHLRSQATIDPQDGER